MMLLKPVTSCTALLKRNQDLAQAYDSSPCMSPAHWSADMDPVPEITAGTVIAILSKISSSVTFTIVEGDACLMQSSLDGTATSASLEIEAAA